MINIFQEIRKFHIIEAAKKIDVDGIPQKNRSRKYDVIVENSPYPPKYIISLAYQIATGQELSCRDFIDNEKFRKDFTMLGFVIELKQKK